MAKIKIGVKEAVADVRAGMDDSALMRKYGLAPDGLQSLLDKLVAGGYIDLSEVEGRLPGFLGTVIISESLLPEQQDEKHDVRQPPKSKSGAWINAQEAARDVRSGMDDSDLMKKYRLSARGLQSLFDKLVAAGAITKGDLDLRHVRLEEHTVALKEDMLTLSQALRHLGFGESRDSGAEITHQPKNPKSRRVVSPSPLVKASPNRKEDDRLREVEPNGPAIERRWHDNPILAVLLLILVFPLGLYSLYRNSSLSARAKVFILGGWVLLAAACGILIARMI